MTLPTKTEVRVKLLKAAIFHKTVVCMCINSNVQWVLLIKQLNNTYIMS